VLYGLLEKDPDRRWDAATARQALRDLLAGPLASANPHFPTDPYSVVPAQVPPYQSANTAAPGGGVGGRAMLPPDSPLGAAPAGPQGRGAPPRSQVGGRAMLPPDSPLGAVAPPGGRAQGGRGPALNEPTAGYEPAADPWRTAPHPAARPSRRDRHRATRDDSPLAQVGALAGQAVTRVRDAVRGLPRQARIAAAVGLAAVILVGVVVLIGGGEDEPDVSAGQQPAGDQASADPADGPPFEVREFADRGIAINLPAAWEQTESTEIRVDFGDPADTRNRRLRLLFERSDRGSREFVENAAEHGIRNNCPQPYERVELADFELAGLPATRLEYTCGSGDEARHALWATVVRDGTAYSFFVTLPPDQFEECKAIFDEMVRTFRFVE
jgi:hypothetical protein